MATFALALMDAARDNLQTGKVYTVVSPTYGEPNPHTLTLRIWGEVEDRYLSTDSHKLVSLGEFWLQAPTYVTRGPESLKDSDIDLWLSAFIPREDSE